MTTVERRRGLVGRGDLVAAIADPLGDDAGLTARLLGFERRPGQAATRGDPREHRVAAAEPSTGTEPAPRRAPERPPTPFWRVVERVDRDDVPHADPPEGTAWPSPSEGLVATDLGPVPGAARPVPRPLTSSAALRRALEHVVRRLRTIGETDVDAVVDRMSRGEPIERLPRRTRRVRAVRIVVVIDRADRLIPFWHDQLEIHRFLRLELVGASLEHAWWLDGPPISGGDVERVAMVAPGLEPGDMVLVLGDLGCYGPRSLRRAWARLGEALGRLGIGAAALVPVPMTRWRAVARHWQTIDWSSPDRPKAGAMPSRSERRERRDRLLELVSWTRRLEPGLLRAVRMELPSAEADVGTEADVWNHPEVGRHPAGLLVPDRVRLERQAALKRTMADPAQRELLGRVVGLVRAWHQPVARELWLDEARGLQSLDTERAWIDDDEREQVLALTAKLRGYVKGRGAGRPSLGSSTDLRGWLERSLRGQTTDAFDHREWGRLLVETWDAVAPAKQRHMPLGMEARMLPSEPDVQERRFVVGQRGDELCVVEEGVTIDPRTSSWVTVTARARWLQVGRMLYALEDEQVRRIPLPEGEVIELATDCVRKVELRLEPKPQWARGMGRDRQGLWVRYGEHRLAWPEWARGVGEDSYGLWAVLRVGDVEQRMRWIEPGAFVMGSPEGEAGRFEWEGPQHEVMLTEGYWLADTPCTQALWQEVMGGNPSRFRSPKRPVERVSWDDVQELFGKLNERVPGLEARLPTEAQWEYACRAGTTTATWAGDLRIRGENDAPLLDDIAWYGGNSGVGYELANGYDSSGWPNKQYPHARAGTRAVGLKRPNPWGLYDMLGNVYEWCADMRRDYRAAAERDPVVTVGPGRVIRGGSWRGYALVVRAANRLWGGPGHRLGYLGFRLARGQGLRSPVSPASPTTQQQGRKQGRGTSPASPGGRGKKDV
jgi:formylglycine-generating enzyme required for sulfatase activity